MIGIFFTKFEKENNVISIYSINSFILSILFLFYSVPNNFIFLVLTRPFCLRQVRENVRR